MGPRLWDVVSGKDAKLVAFVEFDSLGTCLCVVLSVELSPLLLPLPFASMGPRLWDVVSALNSIRQSRHSTCFNGSTSLGRG